MSEHSDSTLILEAAREQISGRLAEWRKHLPKGRVVDGQATSAEYVVGNLSWALAQLDSAPGRIKALRRKAGLEP